MKNNLFPKNFYCC